MSSWPARTSSACGTTRTGTRRWAREEYGSDHRALLFTIIETIVVERIRAAAERSRPYVLRTPLIAVDGALLKLECLQPTGSFKVRGFFAAALKLPKARLEKPISFTEAFVAGTRVSPGSGWVDIKGATPYMLSLIHI